MGKTSLGRARFDGIAERLREMPVIRSPVMWFRSIGCHPEHSTGRLITVMYHGMNAADRRRFANQLNYMKSLGDFVTVAQATELLESGHRITGRHFCVTFDDGLSDAFRYAVPVLGERSIPSAFFIVPDWVSTASALPADTSPKYVSWDDCRKMTGSGVTIGSHSASHRRFSMMDGPQAMHELTVSKSRIEDETRQSCVHFACPWGQPYRDYLPHRDPALAAIAGYRSFFTTKRGAATIGDSPWSIPRVRLEPGWGVSQLRYLFTR